MKETSLEDWLNRQTHRTMRGDEITTYVLSKLYNRHTMIHTARKTWCTILAIGGNVNYAAACHTHLLFMGNHMYGELHPKLLPQPTLQLLPVAQAVTAHPTPVTGTSSQSMASVTNTSQVKSTPLVTTPQTGKVIPTADPAGANMDSVRIDTSAEKSDTNVKDEMPEATPPNQSVQNEESITFTGDMSILHSHDNL